MRWNCVCVDNRPPPSALPHRCRPRSCQYEFTTLIDREYQASIGAEAKQTRIMSVVDVGGLSISNLNKVSVPRFSIRFDAWKQAS
jgi:hypothetical protein